MITRAQTRRRFNVGPHDAAVVSAELLVLLRAAGKLYRRVISSEGEHLRDKDLPALIMDVSDYLMMADMDLDQFFLVDDPVH